MIYYNIFNYFKNKGKPRKNPSFIGVVKSACC